jgi:LysM repeat protein
VKAEAPKAQKPKATAPKTKTLVKSYTVKKGDTWTTVSAKLKTPAKLLARDNKLDTKKYLRIGQKLSYKQTIKLAAAKSPAPAGIAASVPQVTTLAAADASSLAVYEVKKGDTLGSIAARHAMKIKDLKAANDLKDDRIVPGQKLKVLQPGPKPATQSLLAGVQPRDSAPVIHVVNPGETLSGLSKRYGVSQNMLIRANNITDPAKISTGLRIKIPEKDVRAETGDLTSAHLMPPTGETELPEPDAAPPVPEQEEQIAANF